MVRTRNTGWACLVAGAAGLAMVGSANAADLDYASVPSVGYNWSGFYVGVAGGYLSAKTKNSSATEFFDPVTLISVLDDYNSSLKPDGGLFGGYAGYNWQMPGSGFVFGIDGDFYGANAKDRQVLEIYPGGDVSMRQKITSTWSARARVGWAVESFMAYVAGGYAGASMNTKLSDPNFISPSSLSSTHTYNGWTVGGGIDFLVTPNWIVGVDYQYKDLGRKNSTFTATYPLGTYTNAMRTKLTTNQFSFRAGYKF